MYFIIQSNVKIFVKPFLANQKIIRVIFLIVQFWPMSIQLQ